uniref:Uncharacterized protein n=1 Tax=Plectus sambesii TaxID=2011161 RepID=A0A914VK44_9BILA
TLKLYEYLDVVDRYDETPQHTAFFAELVKAIVCEAQRSLLASQLDQSRVLK